MDAIKKRMVDMGVVAANTLHCEYWGRAVQVDPRLTPG